MHGIELYNAKLKEWMFGVGGAPDADPLKHAITLAKLGVLTDVVMGVVPVDVKTFADLHDYVDANEYSEAFSWPGIPTDTDDAVYVELFSQFWDRVQDAVHKWIADGGMKRAAEYISTH
jgi:hypothetical protein